MGVRDSMNHNPLLGAGVALLLLMIGAYLIFSPHSKAAPTDSGPKPVARAWFSNDDGKTWFAEQATVTAPFMKDGKETVRAYVFRASDGTEFVGFLERYTAAGKRAVDAAWEDSPKKDESDPTLAAGADEMEVKRPGETEWVPASSTAAEQIYKVVAPNGQTEELKLFDPK